MLDPFQVAPLMKKLGWLIVLAAMGLVGWPGEGAGLAKPATKAAAAPLRVRLHAVNQCVQGQVLDFTHNHGADRRIWSAALCEKRDLYVYLPPGFDPAKKYPLAIFLHGATQDENFFLQAHVARTDEAIAKGELPPLIIAAPDGSLRGRATIFKPATFFTNSRMGRFEDFVMEDVWDFMHRNFSIRPERDAHAVIGVSMGG